MNFRGHRPTRHESSVARLPGHGPLALALAAAMLLLAGTAAADAPDATAAAEPISEVVVTAQKRAERLQDVPAPVSVVTAEQITLSNAVTVEGLLNEVPGVTLHKGDIPFNSGLFIRGIGTNSLAVGSEPSVGYVVDGVVMGTSGQAFGDLLDVERIEIIPGPQGTLFGKNSSAGVVNVVSRMPGNHFAADADIGYFQGDETRAKASIDLPLTAQLLTRTTVFTGRYDGNVTNLFQPSQQISEGADATRVNGYDHQGVRSIWRYVPTDDLTFTLIGDWREANDNCCAFVQGTPPGTPAGSAAATIAGVTALQSGSGLTYEGDQTRALANSLVTQSLEREHGVSLQADWTVNRYTITNIASYRYWWYNEIRDGDFLPATATYVGTSFEQEHDGGPQTTSTLTDELRLSSPTGGVFEYVAGLYYYHTVQDRFFQRDDVECTASTLAAVSPGLTPCLPGASTYTTPSASADYGSQIVNYAAFGQGTVRLADPLQLIVGLRETHDWIGFYHKYQLPTVAGAGLISPTCTQLNPAIPGSGSCPEEGGSSTTHSNLSGKAGLEWHVLPTEMAYVTYARGYKGPAYNVFFNQNEYEAAPLAPETSVDYEGGLKSTLLGGNAYVNVAIFHEAFDNYQANSPTILNGAIVSQLTNAGAVATQGFELTGAARVTPAWGVNGGFTYADAHVTHFLVPPNTPNPLAIAPPGSPLPFAPTTKFNLATDYRWTGQLPFDVVAATNYDYTSTQYTDFATCTTVYCPHGGDNPYLRLHGYGLWNASVGFTDRDERLQLNLIVKNILNRSYSNFDEVGGPAGSILYFIPRDANRYFGLDLHWKFGG